MPSAAIGLWSSDRLARLEKVRSQCLAVLASVPGDPLLYDECLRGWVVLLSAHFQGFCRDLYTEATQLLVAELPSACQPVAQVQFNAELKLGAGNPNLDNLDRDFHRFGLPIKAMIDREVAFQTPKRHLSELNKWRNKAAHHTDEVLPALSVSVLGDWTRSCGLLAGKLDDIVYTGLKPVLGRPPW